MMRPQDIAVLLKIATLETDDWRQIDVALALGVSQSEVYLSLKRLGQANLYDTSNRKPKSRNACEFIVHGLKYVFPAALQASTRGVPTAWGVSPVREAIRAPEDTVPVWPMPKGKHVGPGIAPLYKTLPEMASGDKRLHQLLAMVDVLRVGRAREQKMAVKVIREALGCEE